jgi:flagellar protein FlbD
MIKLTRLNHTPLIVNSDLIEHIEVTPDTVVTLTSGQKLIVLESAEEIVEKVITFRRSILGNVMHCPVAAGSGAELAAELRSHGR